MNPTSIMPWLDPQSLITEGMGVWALVLVCALVFAETGLLVGFFLPGDTLLFFTGLLTYTGVITVDIWWVALAVGVAAFLGGEVGYIIGHKVGPPVFERKESGLFSIKNVERTNAFFERFGPLAVVLARFVPVIRTFIPVAAGVGHMDYRRYSLYNFVGAVLWGIGVTSAGYLLAQIPWIKSFAEKYIDLVLIAIVVLSILPAVFHYVKAAHAARKLRRAQQAVAAAPHDPADTTPLS